MYAIPARCNTWGTRRRRRGPLLDPEVGDEYDYINHVLAEL
jgi:hypothetical protein